MDDEQGRLAKYASSSDLDQPNVHKRWNHMEAG